MIRYTYTNIKDSFMDPNILPIPQPVWLIYFIKTNNVSISCSPTKFHNDWINCSSVIVEQTHINRSADLSNLFEDHAAMVNNKHTNKNNEILPPFPLENNRFIFFICSFENKLYPQLRNHTFVQHFSIKLFESPLLL